MALAIVLVAGPTTTIKAQTAKASTTAGAEIVSAISLTSDASLSFGKMSAPSADVDVTLTTEHVLTPDKPSNISLLPATFTNAHYNVSGAKDYVYTITLPASNTVTIRNGANSMKVENFQARTTSVPVSNGTSGTLNASGQDAFVVGATLKVTNAQAIGAYTGTFDVLVAYN